MSWRRGLIHRVGGLVFYTTIAVVALAVTFAVMMYQWADQFGAVDVVVHRSIPSPDGRMSAIVYGVEGNATVGFNTQVSIAPADRPFSRDKNPSFLALAGQHDLAVSWVSDKLIEIDIPENVKVYRNEPSVSGVTIDYK